MEIILIHKQDHILLVIIKSNHQIKLKIGTLDFQIVNYKQIPIKLT
jgi:hypothetical protein